MHRLLPFLIICLIGIAAVLVEAIAQPPANPGALHVRNPNLPPYVSPGLPKGVIWYGYQFNCRAWLLMSTDLVNWQLVTNAIADGKLRTNWFSSNAPTHASFAVLFSSNNQSNGLAVIP